MDLCEKYQIDLLEAYSGAGEAPSEAGAHLRTCEFCRRELGQIRAITEGLQEPPLSDPGELFFIRQSKQLMARLQEPFDVEEDAELTALLKGIPAPAAPSEFFASQSRAIMERIAEAQAPRPASFWARSLLAAAALAVVCWGAVRFVPFQSLQTSSYQTAVLPAAPEDASDLDLEVLTSQELDRLASKLEKNFLSEAGEDWDDEDMDWEDLSDAEINVLIERLQQGRRST